MDRRRTREPSLNQNGIDAFVIRSGLKIIKQSNKKKEMDENVLIKLLHSLVG